MFNNESDPPTKYKSFFLNLVDTMKNDHGLSTSLKMTGRNYHNFQSGFSSNIRYACSFRRDKSVETALYMDRNPGAKEVFNVLLARRSSIEKSIGEELSWNPQNGRIRCDIAVYRPGSISDDEEALKEIQGWMENRLRKFKEVFGQQLAQIIN